MLSFIRILIIVLASLPALTLLSALTISMKILISSFGSEKLFETRALGKIGVGAWLGRFVAYGR